MPDENVVEIAPAPEAGTYSESEEMYLITVARVVEDGTDAPVGVAVLAKELQVSVASANQMVRKLADRELLTYEPYHGVELTGRGASVADRVLRTRRLWATFLADHLGFSPRDADDQACLLEHVTVPDATDRLAEFLGNPETGPLGRPIPRPEGRKRTSVATRPLTAAAVNTDVEIIGISCPERIRTFLAAEGVVPGASVRIMAIGNQAVLLQVPGGQIDVATDLAHSIEVRDG